MGSFPYYLLSVSFSMYSYTIFMIGSHWSLPLLEALLLLSGPFESPHSLISLSSLSLELSLLMPSLYMMTERLPMEVVIVVVFTPVILGSTPVLSSRLAFSSAAVSHSASEGLLLSASGTNTICYESKSTTRFSVGIPV